MAQDGCDVGSRWIDVRMDEWLVCERLFRELGHTSFGRVWYLVHMKLGFNPQNHIKPAR